MRVVEVGAAVARATALAAAWAVEAWAAVRMMEEMTAAAGAAVLTTAARAMEA